MLRNKPWTRGLRDVTSRSLEHPELYRALQRSVGSDHVWRVFVQEYLRPYPGMRVLDVGCGPAEVLHYLPDVDYLGIDPHGPYIEGACERHGDRGRFRCCPIDALEGADAGPYDVVLLLGVLHHVDDQLSGEIAACAARLLAPGGRLLALDACRAPHQPRLTRFLFWTDRGHFIRDEAAYTALLEPHFGSVRGTLRHDLLRFPYTHLVVEAR